MTNEFPARLSPIISSIRQTLMQSGISDELRAKLRDKLHRFEAEKARRIAARG